MMACAQRSWWRRGEDERSSSAIRSAPSGPSEWPGVPAVRRQGRLHRGVALTRRHWVRWDEYEPFWRSSAAIWPVSVQRGPLQNGPLLRRGERPTLGLSAGLRDRA